jgi:hypothetical protein
MQCCGVELLTGFCPTCGRARLYSHIDCLLRYVRHQAKTKKAMFLNAKKLLEEERYPLADDREWAERQMQRAKVTAAKWDEWEKALEQCMADQRSLHLARAAD